MWCIAPKENAGFVCQMDAVLAVYKRPFDADHPVVCIDETTKQCTREIRAPTSASRGHTERYDGEYQRNGVAHLMLFFTPLENKLTVRIADNHAAGKWAQGVRQLVQEQYPDASKITLVMDNLSTHSGASLYKTFEPELAHALLQKLEVVFTPKHGSWLNMAECEFSVMARQCLDRRMTDVPTLTKESAAWQNTRNQNSKPADSRMMMKQNGNPAYRTARHTAALRSICTPSRRFIDTVSMTGPCCDPACRSCRICCARRARHIG